MASTASEKSFAKTPRLWTASAITPANGPSPTATTNISANTISLMARQASIRRRTGCTTHCGQMLAEARMENGMPNTTASAVPQIAIWTVTSVSAT
jgi:hypothetical protein